MTSGGREVLKWLALVLMTGDHVNKAIFQGEIPGISDASRVVFPIFALVLAYNLVRIQAIGPALVRLAIAAAIAQPFHVWAFGYPMPLNVLATFAVSLGMMRLWLADRRIFALGIGLVGSVLVDYGLAGVFLTFATWLWLRGEKWALFPAVFALVGICVYNGNTWALAALPLVWAFGDLELEIPRWRWLFLGYYVGHLVILAALSGGSDASNRGAFHGAGAGSGGAGAGLQVRQGQGNFLPIPALQR